MIFNCFKHLTPQQVKVILIGQDPYPRTDTYTYTNKQGEVKTAYHACGMCFSVPRTCPEKSYPRSLKNVFTNLRKSYPDIKLQTGDLTYWALQGVLLMNTNLTLKDEDGDIWSSMTSSIIDKLVEANPRIILVCWGSDAKKLCSKWDVENKLESPHPVARNQYGKDFLENNHFQIINDLLEMQGLPAIDWELE